jgi:hypothetical protein
VRAFQGLSEAAKVEPSKAVRKAYAVALGNVGKYAPAKRFGRLLEDTLSLHSAPGDDHSRHFCAATLRVIWSPNTCLSTFTQLVKRVPPKNMFVVN